MERRDTCVSFFYSDLFLGNVSLKDWALMRLVASAAVDETFCRIVTGTQPLWRGQEAWAV